MPAPNILGAQGPRVGRSHGRLRNSLINKASKQNVYPTRVTPRATATGDAPSPATPPAGPCASLAEAVGDQAGRPPVRSPSAVPNLVQDVVGQQQQMLSSLQASQGMMSQMAMFQQMMAQMTQGLMKFGGRSGRGGRGGEGRQVRPGRLKDLPVTAAPAANQALARKLMAQYGWGAGEWKALKELWTRESSWNAQAANPDSTARGIPQAMMSIHFGPNWRNSRAARRYLNSPKVQIMWGLRYIKERYGRPSRALAKHNASNWY